MDIGEACSSSPGDLARALARMDFWPCISSEDPGIFRVGKHRRRDRPHIARRRLRFEQSAVRANPPPRRTASRKSVSVIPKYSLTVFSLTIAG